MASGKKLAWRQKFAYQVIQSLVDASLRIQIDKIRYERDGDVNERKNGNIPIGIIIITVVIVYHSYTSFHC